MSLYLTNITIVVTFTSVSGYFISNIVDSSWLLISHLLLLSAAPALSATYRRSANFAASLLLCIYHFRYSLTYRSFSFLPDAQKKGKGEKKIISRSNAIFSEIIFFCSTITTVDLCSISIMNPNARMKWTGVIGIAKFSIAINVWSEYEMFPWRFLLYSHSDVESAWHALRCLYIILKGLKFIVPQSMYMEEIKDNRRKNIFAACHILSILVWVCYSEGCVILLCLDLSG